MHGKLLNHLWIFSTPNSTILFVYIATELKMRLIGKDDFLRKITVDLLMLQYPIGKCMALRMVFWMQWMVLCQLDLVSMQMQILCQNSLHRASWNVQLLSTMANRGGRTFVNTRTHCGYVYFRPTGTRTATAFRGQNWTTNFKFFY